MYDLVTDKSFDLEKTYEYILSIQVSLNGFSFSILSSAEDKILAFKTIRLKISNSALISRRFKEWLESEEILKKPFKKVRIIVFSKHFTLVPEKYSHNNLKLEIPKLLFEENTDLEVAENVISTLKTRLLFTLPNGLNSIVQQQIGECEIIHPVKIILNKLPKTEKENGLVLLFDTNDFYLILFNKSKVILTNSYKIANKNDALYYILTTLKQVSVALSQTELYLTESEYNLSEYKESLQPYFKEIRNLKLTAFLSGLETV